MEGKLGGGGGGDEGGIGWMWEGRKGGGGEYPGKNKR